MPEDQDAIRGLWNDLIQRETMSLDDLGRLAKSLKVYNHILAAWICSREVPASFPFFKSWYVPKIPEAVMLVVDVLNRPDVDTSEIASVGDVYALAISMMQDEGFNITEKRKPFSQLFRAVASPEQVSKLDDFANLLRIRRADAKADPEPVAWTERGALQTLGTDGSKVAAVRDLRVILAEAAQRPARRNGPRAEGGRAVHHRAPGGPSGEGGGRLRNPDDGPE